MSSLFPSVPTALSLSGDDVTDLDLVDSVYPSPWRNNLNIFIDYVESSKKEFFRTDITGIILGPCITSSLGFTHKYWRNRFIFSVQAFQ